MAKITLYGFYKWMKNAGDDLFSELNVPAGLDKNTLIDNIIIRGGEYEVLYADPYFMQDAIRVWSDKWQSTFKRWVDAMAKDYDPLYNYDRYEEWTDNNTGTIDNKLSGTNSGTVTDTGSIRDQGTIKDSGTVKDTGDIKNSGTQKFDITEQHSGGDDTTTTRTGSENVETDMDTTTTKAAYNSNALLPDNKVEQDGTVTTTYNSVKDVVDHDDSLKIVTDNDRTDDLTTTNNLTRTNDLTQTNDLTRTNNMTRTDNLAHSESSTRTDNMTSTHDAHIYGNIGVTTSSAMLAEYMDTQAKYQLVDQITDIFLREFVIPIF